MKGSTGVPKRVKAKPKGYAIRTGLFVEAGRGKRLELLACDEGSWFERSGASHTRCRGLYADQQSDLRVSCDSESPIHSVISLEEAFSVGLLGLRDQEAVTVTIESLETALGIRPPQARMVSLRVATRKAEAA